MLDLRSWNKTMAHFAQRFTDADLPAELSTAAFVAFDTTRIPADILDWGAQAWGLRALDEYRSLAAFTEFLNDMVQVGLPFDIISSGVRIVRDEMRHVELCRRMVEALGGSSQIPGEPQWVFPDRSQPLRTRVIRTVVSGFCVAETMSVAMLVATHEHAVDPLAKALTTTLAADESFHSRFGWTALDALLPILTSEELDDLYELLPSYMAGLDQVLTLARQDLAIPQHELNPFGELPPQARLDAFSDALENDILQRFQDLGIDARAAWNGRPRYEEAA